MNEMEEVVKFERKWHMGFGPVPKRGGNDPPVANIHDMSHSLHKQLGDQKKKYPWFQ